MARQSGIVKLEGTIGNISFYKSQDGFLAREKGGVDGARIANDPAFQRTRENGSEFGSAGAAGKLLRTALRALILSAADNRMVGRLTREMVKVIQADLVSTRGQRNVIDGEAELLQGFEFNVSGKLSTTLFAPYTATINRVTGDLDLNIPSFIAANMIGAPSGATHFKINTAGAEVDFTNGTYVVDTQSSAELPLNGVATSVINLVNAVTANSTHPLFLAVGIEFYQEVNGVKYSLRNGSYNSLALVKVDGN
jgi:hypothetical protein